MRRQQQQQRPNNDHDDDDTENEMIHIVSLNDQVDPQHAHTSSVCVCVECSRNLNFILYLLETKINLYEPHTRNGQAKRAR